MTTPSPTATELAQIEARAEARRLLFPLVFVECDIPHARDHGGYLVDMKDLIAAANDGSRLLTWLRASMAHAEAHVAEVRRQGHIIVAMQARVEALERPDD